MTAPDTLQMAARLGCAVVAGVLIGIERESHGRAAGLRTTILACVASALAMILSEIIFWQSNGPNWRPDPARLAAGILTGIGFLGGGTILRHDNAIRGVTTAATLWFATVLGLVFGSGQFVLGFAGLGIALVTLLALTGFEKRIPTDWYAKLSVTMRLDAMTDAELRHQIETSGAAVKSMQLEYDLAAAQKCVTTELKLKRPVVFDVSQKIIAELKQKPGVLSVKWM
jgi:putative Mg2+ transporter-C (MgtC) family protein